MFTVFRKRGSIQNCKKVWPGRGKGINISTKIAWRKSKRFEKKTFDCFAFSRDTNKSEVYIIERYSEIEN